MAKASAAQMKLLSELRAKELKDLTPAEYGMVEREVSANGFQDLKGTAAQIVFNAIRKRDKEMKKARSVSAGDMVTWNSSGGNASGKVIRVVASGKINVPDSSFTIEGTEDDPAALIQLYRDGKPTETKVGHKVSTLKKSVEVLKHGNHDQGSHGSWAGNGKGGSGGKNIQDMSMSDQKEFTSRMSSAKSYEEQRKIIGEFKSRMSSKPKLDDVSSKKYNTDDSEGEDSSEPKNYKDKAPKISYNSNDTEGEFGDNTDDPKWMDEMDVLRPPKRTPGEKAPFGGINFAATWRRTQK